MESHGAIFQCTGKVRARHSDSIRLKRGVLYPTGVRSLPLFGDFFGLRWRELLRYELLKTPTDCFDVGVQGEAWKFKLMKFNYLNSGNSRE